MIWLIEGPEEFVQLLPNPRPRRKHPRQPLGKGRCAAVGRLLLRAASIIGRTILDMSRIHPECFDPEAGDSSVAADGLVAGDSEEDDEEEEKEKDEEENKEEDEDEGYSE